MLVEILLVFFIIAFSIVSWYFVKSINKCIEFDNANTEMSKHLNEIIQISKLISKNIGWMKNKDLARIVYTAQKLEKFMINEKENNSENGTKKTDSK